MPWNWKYSSSPELLCPPKGTERLVAGAALCCFPSKYWVSCKRDSGLHVPFEWAADNWMKPLLTKGRFSCTKAWEESLSCPCRICCDSVHHSSKSWDWETRNQSGISESWSFIPKIGLRQIYGCGWAPETSKHAGEKDPFHRQLGRNRIVNLSLSYLLKEQRRPFNCHTQWTQRQWQLTKPCLLSTVTVLLHCLHDKEKGWEHHYKWSSPLFDPPYHFTGFGDGRERACRQNVLTNPVFFPPASRTGNLGITTLNFLKNWTSEEIHWSRNSAGTTPTLCYLYCSSTRGSDGALWPFSAGDTHVLEKQWVGGWGAAQPESHSTWSSNVSHRPLAVNPSSEALPSNLNQNLGQTDSPHLLFLLFHTCILLWEQTLASGSRTVSQPHDHLTWQSSVLTQYLTSSISYYAFYSCYFCLPQWCSINYIIMSLSKLLNKIKHFEASFKKEYYLSSWECYSSMQPCRFALD